MVTDRAEVTLIKLTTDEGLVGWGEATPLHSINGETQKTVLAACEDLLPVVLGSDPRAPRPVVDLMEYLMPNQHAAASAIEMALMDLASQAVGLPLVRYLGGDARPLPTDQTIGIKPPHEAASAATRFAKQGHKTIKVKVGSTLDDDVDRVAAVREAIGSDVAIRIDANQGYRSDDALMMLMAISELDVEFCEQPVPRHDHDGLARVAQGSPIPIMADESVFSPTDAIALIKADACNLFNVKLSKSRGILRGLEIADIVKSAYGWCMVGGMIETRLGMTAAAHMGAARPTFRYFDLDSFTGHTEDPMQGGAIIRDGDVLLSDAPGLGIAPDPKWVNPLHVKTLKH